jgi:cysteine synthase A
MSRAVAAGPPPLTDRLVESVDVDQLRAAFARAHADHRPLADFAETLGDTPLVDVPGPRDVRIVAKLESKNPGGSIKDRVAHAMLAWRLAQPEPVRHVLEYSGGNLAVSLSLLCAQLQLPLTLVLSGASAPSLLRRLVADGTGLMLVDRRAGFRSVIEAAAAAAAEDPHLDFLYQHRHPVNALVHELHTGAELLDQLGAAPDAYVASIGSGGSLVGVARTIRRRRPEALVVGATPAEMPYATTAVGDARPRYAGSGGLGRGVRQPVVEAQPLVDRHEHVDYPEALRAMVALRRETGLTVGSSAAANWLVAQRVAATLPTGSVVATVFPCAGTPEEWERAEQIVHSVL